jgi:hypothetical protein
MVNAKWLTFDERRLLRQLEQALDGDHQRDSEKILPPVDHPLRGAETSRSRYEN